jgi:ABC-type cobalamin/Fe3+-siderophores transport system ATPase subunit
MIEVTNLTKAYGETLAVDDLSFTVRPGIVTGFLGPNGSGKSTTMRMILGLDAPTSGTATVDGRPLAEHPRPLASLGSLLEARAVHPTRSARTTTCGRSPSRTASAPTGSTRCSTSSASATSPDAAAAASRSAWVSAWASPVPSSAIPGW